VVSPDQLGAEGAPARGREQGGQVATVCASQQRRDLEWVLEIKGEDKGHWFQTASGSREWNADAVDGNQGGLMVGNSPRPGTWLLQQ